jgi:glycosyltransferase involved in cell wall biosynthesis
VGAFVSYKRFDLALMACEIAKVPFVLAGFGEEEKSLSQLLGAYSSLKIRPSDRELEDLLTQTKALIFPGVEDFGMIAIEAMACGIPVIAYSKGGARDFIEEGKTGLFFHEPTKESLGEALAAFQGMTFDSEYIKAFSLKFSEEHFKKNIASLIFEAPQ